MLDRNMVDQRPLSERLAEQRLLEEEQYRESVRLSNFVRKLEYDELAFLNEVKAKKESIKNQIETMDKLEVAQFERKVQIMDVKEKPLRIDRPKPYSKKKSSAKKRLSGLVKRK